MQKDPQKASWRLKASDFSKKTIHAEQDWRFQMFFEYLRISPSYNLANQCKNERELAKKIKDKDKAQRVWKTYSDIGNVYGVLYRGWWLENGLRLFGIHTAKPKTQKIVKLSHTSDNKTVSENLIQYLDGDYKDQGKPDSLLVSIPLGKKRMAIMRELRRLLDEAHQDSINKPKAIYTLENNKMRYRRLLAGLRLIYMQSAKPDEALWRIATRARISHSHGRLDPNAKKRDSKSAESRRMLTIMASRLIRDTLIISENAAQGLFPSLKGTSVQSFDSGDLRKLIYENNKWEQDQKGR
jgi:hypothetical protein